MASSTWQDTWQEVGATIAQEFSDLPDAAQVTQIVLRLTLAALLGGLLGFEREHRGKAAGVRTHMLVALGSAMFVMIPQHAGLQEAELSRVLQGIVAGVGFLCAGTILKGRSDEDVKGLTTAAGIWLTAAIGVAAGLGRESTAVLSTLLALVILSLVPLVTRLIDRHAPDAGEPDDEKRATKRAAARRQDDDSATPPPE
jgi:putative Mg2+ transporter-C (MgtC) family protein